MLPDKEPKNKEIKQASDTASKTADKTESKTPAKTEKKALAFSFDRDVSAPTVLLFAVFCLLLISENLTAANYLNSGNPYLATVVIQLCIFVLPCAFYCTLKRINIGKDCRAKPMSGKGMLLTVAGVPAVIFTAAALKYVQCYVFGERLGSAVAASSSGDFAYMLLSYAIVPCITEELCFRGVALSEYEKKCGKLAAVAVTSLVFAMLHFNARDFAAYFAVGLIIGITVCAADSVFAGMIMHFCNNLFGIYTDNLIVKISGDTSGGRLALAVLLVLCLASLMVWFHRLESVYSEREKKSEKTPTLVSTRIRLMPSGQSLGKALAQIVLSPAFVCVAVAFVLKIAAE